MRYSGILRIMVEAMAFEINRKDLSLMHCFLYSFNLVRLVGLLGDKTLLQVDKKISYMKLTRQSSPRNDDI